MCPRYSIRIWWWGTSSAFNVCSELINVSLTSGETRVFLYVEVYRRTLHKSFFISFQLVLLRWFVRCYTSGVLLRDASSKICSKQHAPPSCRSLLAFSSSPSSLDFCTTFRLSFLLSLSACSSLNLCTVFLVLLFNSFFFFICLHFCDKVRHSSLILDQFSTNTEVVIY